MFNKVILVGRITHDPELKATTSGTEIVNFQLAVNRYGKDNKADFFKVVCFGKTAEFMGKYVHKGNLLLVEGSLRDNRWTDESGQKRRTTEIIAQRIQLLEKKKVEEATEQLPPPEDAFDIGSVENGEEGSNEAPF